MNTTGSSLHHLSSSGWRLLGKLEVPTGSSGAAIIYPQLEEIFQSLNLQADLLNRLLSSAQDAADRALQADNVSKAGHIHLIVFAPAEVTTRDGNWGFFRIERMENGSNSASPDHAIEFYLYCE